MELKEFCISLKTARRLSEVGIKIDSKYWWVKTIYDYGPSEPDHYFQLIPDDSIKVKRSEHN
jgi:hypothetical protein